MSEAVQLPCRSPRGSVDRNTERQGIGFDERVAPRAGAWIETTLRGYGSRVAASLPARERGSKQIFGRAQSYPCQVAPRAGAWIETWPKTSICLKAASRSPRGSVDRNENARLEDANFEGSLPARERGSKQTLGVIDANDCGRSPRGSVDRNIKTIAERYEGTSRSPRGSVDRNVNQNKSLSDL